MLVHDRFLVHRDDGFRSRWAVGLDLLSDSEKRKPLLKLKGEVEAEIHRRSGGGPEPENPKPAKPE